MHILQDFVCTCHVISTDWNLLSDEIDDIPYITILGIQISLQNISPQTATAPPSVLHIHPLWSVCEGTSNISKHFKLEMCEVIGYHSKQEV